ncbi:MAG: hypothetical protein ACI4F1_13950 [Bariatricus sp.]
MAKSERRFADDGWAIWIEGDDTSTVYLNEWMNPKKTSFLDIGLHIHGVKSSYMLNVYIPFPITADEIDDISLLQKDESVLCAIFGTSCQIDYKKNQCTSEISYNEKNVDLLHISCTEYSVEPFENGTMLQVPFDTLREYLANDEIYILFRVPHKSLNETFEPRNRKKRLFVRFHEMLTSPVVEEKYGYSIRINEARVLPAEISRKEEFRMQKLKKAIVTISVNEEYELNDSNCYRIRRMEEELFRDFLPVNYQAEDAITYQWQQSRETNLYGHFNFYFTMRHGAASKGSIILYMIILLILGAGGNATWTLVQYLFSLL